jgi:hypothetical protein
MQPEAAAAAVAAAFTMLLLMKWAEILSCRISVVVKWPCY